MIINCDPRKTELIGFGTAENDETLLPMSFHLGSNKIKFVEKTKVVTRLDNGSKARLHRACKGY